MRILSEEEMDEVFGGQATKTVIPTLNTVTVTATRVQSYSGSYWLGGGNGFAGYDESSGSSGACYLVCDTSGCYYNYPSPALANIPTPEKLKCIMDAVAVPGNDLRIDHRFAVVNGYGYFNTSTGELKLSSTPITPPAGYVGIYGMNTKGTPTSSDPTSGTTFIYAAGMTGSGSGTNYGSYYDGAGNLVASYTLGVMSAIERAVLTAAHEARHQYTSWDASLVATRDVEADARTYAIKALEKFRTGAGQNCT